MYFLRDILMTYRCPEYNGYNTKYLRDINAPSNPKTVVNYEPLLDMIPTEPDTILTSMCAAQQVSRAGGQDFTVMTCNQQLYKIAVQIQWNKPEWFQNMTIRLCGMHMLMSFNGMIATLMKGMRLEDVMVFGDIKKILEGKSFHIILGRF